jgi:hypothetical protein
MTAAFGYSTKEFSCLSSVAVSRRNARLNHLNAREHRRGGPLSYLVEWVKFPW